MNNHKNTIPYGEVDYDGITLIKGDCLEVMKQIPSGTIDAIITDPPYG